jgi:hypothetical protein
MIKNVICVAKWDNFEGNNLFYNYFVEGERVVFFLFKIKVKKNKMFITFDVVA